MTDLFQEWVRSASIGWVSAEAGDYDKALRCYKYCDEITESISVKMNPELSLLRHTIGEADGYVQPLAPAEDSVLSLEVNYGPEQGVDADYTEQLPANIDIHYKNHELPYFVKENVKKEMPHVMVLSTGRCGTVSLYHLFERSHYLPYHTYFFHVPVERRYEMMCRLHEGNSDGYTEFQWVKTRLAEWIGSVNINRPMITMNHLDTIFAPVFALLHPKSRFIYLRRDPVAVFKSFYNKNQWTDLQLTALNYKFEPFQWRRMGFDKPKAIAWYIKFTENFSRSFGKAMGERFIELSSNKLFAQDLNEINRLKVFTGIDLSEKEIAEHFSTVYNEKAHKVTMTDLQLASGVDAFRREYDAL